MTEQLVTIEVDGKTLQAPKGAMLIEVLDEKGIYVPRFCYHKKLSIPANCRMCLVEVDRPPKPVPACATPVADGMKVWTRSPKAIEAQKGTMEFLLINHPLDCPICDQGGECELQDMSMGYGSDVSRFCEGKRVVADEDLGPLVATEMTRCIHCTRCVRFGAEIAGMQELGGMYRGEHTRIETYVGKTLESELSGNVIDLCPVGALTAKPSRFRARAWELIARPSIAPHDGFGSNIECHVRNQELIRVIPRENEAVNETWIADRDRFSYLGVYHEDRMLHPAIKTDNQWRETSWDEALEAAVEGLRKIASECGGDQIGILIAPGATLEEMLLARRLAEGLGGASIDHRLRQQDFSQDAWMPRSPGIGETYPDFQHRDYAWIVGADLRRQIPMFAHRVRAAAEAGMRVSALHALDCGWNFELENNWIQANIPNAVAQVASAVRDKTSRKLPSALKKLMPDLITDEARAIAEDLIAASSAGLLLGADVIHHPAFGQIFLLARWISEVCDVKLSLLPEGANGTGAWLAGAVPHREIGGFSSDVSRLDARAMLDSPRAAYILIGIEPDMDCAHEAIGPALKQARHVVTIHSFMNDALREFSHVALPAATFAENEGSYINLAGAWQDFSAVIPPLGEARPCWKILRMLGSMMEFDGFDSVSASQIATALRQKIDKNPESVATGSDGWDMQQSIESWEMPRWLRMGSMPVYRADGMVRRSEPLNRMPQTQRNQRLHMHPADLHELNLATGDHLSVRQGATEAVLEVSADPALARGVIYIAPGFKSSAELGWHYDAIQIIDQPTTT